MRIVVDYFKKYPYAVIIILVMLTWMAVNGIQGNKAAEQLANEGRFTLATVKGIKGAKSGRWVTVDFIYEGRKYETETRNETISHSLMGEKIFIKFLPSRPTEVEYYDNIDVPDSILSLQSRIWDTLPVK